MATELLFRSEMQNRKGFDELPGGVYTLSYLRQYARSVGVDEADLLRRYREKTAPPPAAEPDSDQVKLARWLRESQLARALLHRPRHHESRSHT